MRPVLRPTPCLAVLATTAACLTAAAATAAPHATATTPVVACNQTAVQSAITKGGAFTVAGDCDLQLSKTLVVPRGRHVTIDGGGTLKLDGLDPTNTYSVRVMKIRGHAQVVLEHLTVVGGLATGKAGKTPAAGADGASATTAGARGADGSAPAPSADLSGEPAFGGGLYISSGAVVGVRDVAFENNTAAGGNGADGAAGGAGGRGGDSLNATTNAGDGGNGGDGGPGGNGAAALGGAIYNGGELAIVNSTFDRDLAVGGDGGNGGEAGRGGAGGDVDCTSNPCTGIGGAGGTGGDSGRAGSGGAAVGGSIYSAGPLSLSHVRFNLEGAQGGLPGSGLVGGDGGTAGCQSQSSTCSTGGDGGTGGAGGNGGAAVGGAVFSARPAVAGRLTYVNDSLHPGIVGPGCPDAANGCGGLGGLAGGAGGTNGGTGTDGASGPATHVNALFRFTKLAPLRIDPVAASARSARRGHHYALPLRAHGGIHPYRWRARGLPRGLHLDAARGRIRGVPHQAGRFHVTLTVTDPWSARPTPAHEKVTLRVKR